MLCPFKRGDYVEYVGGQDIAGCQLFRLINTPYRVTCTCWGSFTVSGLPIWLPAIYLENTDNRYAFRADMFEKIENVLIW